MTSVFCTRSDWLIHVPKLEGYDVLTIHPRDGLTVKMIAEAMAAQKLLYERPGQPAFRIIEHGTKIFIQRNMIGWTTPYSSRHDEKKPPAQVGEKREVKS